MVPNMSSLDVFGDESRVELVNIKQLKQEGLGPHWIQPSALALAGFINRKTPNNCIKRVFHPHIGTCLQCPQSNEVFPVH